MDPAQPATVRLFFVESGEVPASHGDGLAPAPPKTPPLAELNGDLTQWDGEVQFAQRLAGKVPRKRGRNGAPIQQTQAAVYPMAAHACRTKPVQRLCPPGVTVSDILILSSSSRYAPSKTINICFDYGCAAP